MSKLYGGTCAVRERGGAYTYTVSVRHWLVFRCAPRTDWGGAHLTAPLLRQRPLPEGLLVLRRGVAAPSLGLLPEKETGRIGASLGRRLCGSGLRARGGGVGPKPAATRAATDYSKNKQEKKMLD